MLILRRLIQELLQDTFAGIIKDWYKTSLLKKWSNPAEEEEEEEEEDSGDEYEFSDQPSSSPRKAVTGKRKLGTFYVTANKRHNSASV